MSGSKTSTEQKIAVVGEEIQRQFEKIGEEIKTQIIKDFKVVLDKDLNELRGVLNSIIKQQNTRILKQSERDLQQAIKDQFGGSAFGNILADSILPAVFDGSTRDKFRSNEFKQAVAQSLLELGRSVARAQSRNG